MPRRDGLGDYGLRSGLERGVSLWPRRVLLGLLLGGLGLFAFGFPRLERRMHAAALATEPAERWGPHLVALCALEAGREPLFEQVEAATGERRQQLLLALAERRCLDGLSVELQAEAWLLLVANDDEASVAALAPSSLVASVLESAVLTLARSEPGSTEARKALVVLERHQGALNHRHLERLALPLARQLPEPAAEHLLVNEGEVMIPLLFQELDGPPEHRAAAVRALDLLSPRMTDPQSIEWEIWKMGIAAPNALPDLKPPPEVPIEAELDAGFAGPLPDPDAAAPTAEGDVAEGEEAAPQGSPPDEGGDAGVEGDVTEDAPPDDAAEPPGSAPAEVPRPPISAPARPPVERERPDAGPAPGGEAPAAPEDPGSAPAAPEPGGAEGDAGEIGEAPRDESGVVQPFSRPGEAPSPELQRDAGADPGADASAPR